MSVLLRLSPLCICGAMYDVWFAVGDCGLSLASSPTTSDGTKLLRHLSQGTRLCGVFTPRNRRVDSKMILTPVRRSANILQHCADFLRHHRQTAETDFRLATT